MLHAFLPSRGDRQGVRDHRVRPRGSRGGAAQEFSRRNIDWPLQPCNTDFGKSLCALYAVTSVLEGVLVSDSCLRSIARKRVHRCYGLIRCLRLHRGHGIRRDTDGSTYTRRLDCCSFYVFLVFYIPFVFDQSNIRIALIISGRVVLRPFPPPVQMVLCMLTVLLLNPAT